MTVTVKRFGGMMARPPKEKQFSLGELDKPALDAMRKLLKADGADGGRPADGFTYKFEVNEPGIRGEVAVPGHQVPDALRKFLP